MSEANTPPPAGDERLLRIRQSGLGPGLELAEERQRIGQTSPSSRFGPLGAIGKGAVRRALKFHTERQGEFNTGVTSALREAETALMAFGGQLTAFDAALGEVRGDIDHRLADAVETIRAQTAQLEDAASPQLAEVVEKIGQALSSANRDTITQVLALQEKLGGQAESLEEHARSIAQQAQTQAEQEGGIAALRLRTVLLRRTVGKLQRWRWKWARLVERRIEGLESAASETAIRLRHEVGIVESEMEAQGLRIEHGERALSEARTRTERIDAGLAHWSERLDDRERTMLARVDQLGKRAHDVAERVDELAGHEQAVKEELADLSRREQTVTERIEELCRRADTAQVRIDESDERAHTVLARVDDLSERERVQAQRLDELAGREETAGHRVTALEAALGETRQNVEPAVIELREELATIAARASEWEQLEAARLDECEEQLRVHGGHCEATDSRLNDVEQRTGEIERGLAERLGQLEAAQAANARGLQSVLEEGMARLEQRVQAIEGERSGWTHQLASLAARLPELESTASAQSTQLGDITARLTDVVADLQGVERNTAALEQRLPEDELERLQRGAAATRKLADSLGTRLVRLEGRVQPSLELDYLAFERRFRGEESEIRERMRPYVELFAGTAKILDGGCGRGEFLEVCRELEVNAYGVDADADMVSCCRVKGLPVVQGDLLAHLDALDDRSLDGLFASQVVEHFEPVDLLRLLELAAQKLRRGGKVVLETVNPDTYSALRTFFVDPTHRRPLPSRMLAYLLEEKGFTVKEVRFSSHLPEEQKIQPIQPKTRAKTARPAWLDQYNDNCARLNDILFGAQDYAVIAEL